jgi:hypothetical protein
MPEDELRDADESGAEVRPPKAVGKAPVVASPWHMISAAVGDAGAVERSVPALHHLNKHVQLLLDP